MRRPLYRALDRKKGYIIVREVQDHGHRILFYSEENPSFYVIAKSEQRGKVQPGDVVIYEPYGSNFGWFVSSTR